MPVEIPLSIGYLSSPPVPSNKITHNPLDLQPLSTVQSLASFLPSLGAEAPHMTATSHADSDMLSESGEFVGNVLSAILYGAYLVLNVLSVNALLANPNITRSRRLFYIAYGTLLFILNTITLAFWTLLGQMQWIIHRNNPGPTQYYSKHYLYWYMLVGDGTQGVANLLADCLMIYRCYVIFNRKLRYIILPFICLLSFIVSFIIVEIGSLHWSESKIWKFNGLNFFCTIGVNVLVTLMISVRLFLVSRKAYATIIAIVVESAVLFTAAGIALSVASLMNSPISGGLMSAWFVIGGISAQLIILRLALGPRASPKPKPVKEKNIASSLDHPFPTKVRQLDSEDVANAAAFVGDSDVPVSEWHVASHNNTYVPNQMSGNITCQLGTIPTIKGVLAHNIGATFAPEDNNRSLGSTFTNIDVHV